MIQLFVTAKSDHDPDPEQHGSALFWLPGSGYGSALRCKTGSGSGNQCGSETLVLRIMTWKTMKFFLHLRKLLICINKFLFCFYNFADSRGGWPDAAAYCRGSRERQRQRILPEPGKTGVLRIHDIFWYTDPDPRKHASDSWIRIRIWIRSLLPRYPRTAATADPTRAR